jgi:hypothetical protein
MKDAEIEIAEGGGGALESLVIGIPVLECEASAEILFNVGGRKLSFEEVEDEMEISSTEDGVRIETSYGSKGAALEGPREAWVIGAESFHRFPDSF